MLATHSLAPFLTHSPTHLYEINVRVLTEIPTSSVSEVNGIDECPKCVATKSSGERSCCARGGAWFKNCGDVGDTKFDHTWAEGIQACKSKLLKCRVMCCTIFGS